MKMKFEASFFQAAFVTLSLIIGAWLVLITARGSAQGASRGDLELAFNDHCRECHAIDKGDNRLGPSLYGIVGKKAGTVPGFSYSEALANSGVIWTPKSLDAWIANPDAMVPGNNMGAVFPGLQDPKERAKIIAFLEEDTKKPGGK